jgi:hypothetical protein
MQTDARRPGHHPSERHDTKNDGQRKREPRDVRPARTIKLRLPLNVPYAQSTHINPRIHACNPPHPTQLPRPTA